MIRLNGLTDDFLLFHLRQLNLSYDQVWKRKNNPCKLERIDHTRKPAGEIWHMAQRPQTKKRGE